MIGIIGAFINFYIGAIVSTLLEVAYTPFERIEVILTLVFMYYGFLTFFQYEAYITILALNSIAFLYNIVGLWILFAVRVEVLGNLVIFGQFEELWFRGIKSLLCSTALSSVLFVAGCIYNYFMILDDLAENQVRVEKVKDKENASSN